MNSWTENKITAGILPLTLAISLIFSLFCLSAILIAYYNNLLWLKTDTVNRLELNSRSALEYMLYDGFTNMKLNSTMSFDLFSEGRDSVKITKKAWGIFDWLNVESFSYNFSYSKNYLVGYLGDIESNLSLYISNSSSSAVTLVGQAKISGNAWLPSKGIKAGVYNRIGFSGSQLVNGQINKSASGILQINQEVDSKISQILDMVNPDIQLKLDDLLNNAMSNSFNNPTQKVYKTEQIQLKHSLKGNIIVVSDSEIIVESGADLNDIILVAPSIQVQSGFKGCIQAFSTKEIVIEPEVELFYPSALITKGREDASIRIMGKALVEGIVFLEGEEKKDVIIDIAAGAILNGQVICTGVIQHMGVVNGQIICNALMIRDNSGQHINYLKDGIIDRNSLSSQYLYAGILTSDLQFPTVLARLY